MKTQVLDQFNPGTYQSYGDSYLSQRKEDFNLRGKEAELKNRFGATHSRPPIIALNFHESCDKEVVEFLQSTYHRDHFYASMSTDEAVILSTDPIVEILDAFYLIPDDYRTDLFNDFRNAGDARDLRQLLDTISDWAATAELYTHSSLAADLRKAIGGRKGVSDWLHG